MAAIQTPAADTILRRIVGWLPAPLTHRPPETGTLPSGRGSEMIIWGGGLCRLDTGGRYDPASDTWQCQQAVDHPHGIFTPQCGLAVR